MVTNCPDCGSDKFSVEENKSQCWACGRSGIIEMVPNRDLTIRSLACLGTRLAGSVESLKAARRLARELHRNGEVPKSLLDDIERSLGRTKLTLAEVGLQLSERGAARTK